MQAFVEVVDEGSFSRAADKLQVPKSTVTRYVQTLEQQLRTRLLNRTTRRTLPTSQGTAYYERASAILVDLRDLEAAMLQAGAAPDGLLRVSLPPELGSTVVIPALPGFLASYPEIRLEVVLRGRMADLARDKLDCAVFVGAVADPSLVARRIGNVRQALCASPSYLCSHGTPLHPRDLEDPRHRMIRFGADARGEAQVLRLWREAESAEINLNRASEFAVDDGAGYLAAALAGLGIAPIFEHLAQDSLDKGSLYPVLAEWKSQPVPIKVAYQATRHVSKRLRVFIDWLVQLFERHALLAPSGPVVGPDNPKRTEPHGAAPTRKLQLVA
jgi:DNA-binding transcriptional LysR family regulator